MIGRRRLVIAIAALAMTVPASLGARQARVVGIVLDLSAPVFLRPSPRGTEIRLTSRDVLRVLVEGQAIRSGPGGRVKIRTADGTRELTATQGPFELRFPIGSQANSGFMSALSAYARPGGSRSFNSPLYSPADQSVVRLDALDVRWSLPSDRGPISLELRQGSGRVVWTSGDVPAAAGRLVGAANAALGTAIRQASGAAADGGAWTLVLREGATVSSTATFRLLSRAAETALAARLRDHDGDEDAAVRAIGRAVELGNAGLHNEAADEFDRLLESSPQSDAVLQAAIGAHTRTGNANRVRALTERRGGGGILSVN